MTSARRRLRSPPEGRSEPGKACVEGGTYGEAGGGKGRGLAPEPSVQLSSCSLAILS